MSIRFKCPQCLTTINSPDNASGNRANCPRCRATVTVPPPMSPPELPSTPQQTIIVCQGKESDPCGVISLILGVLAVISLPFGCCTGFTLIVTAGIGALGGGLAFAARGNLKTAGLILNGLAILPAAIGGILIVFGLTFNLASPAKHVPTKAVPTAFDSFAN